MITAVALPVPKIRYIINKIIWALPHLRKRTVSGVHGMIEYLSLHQLHEVDNLKEKYKYLHKVKKFYILLFCKRIRLFQASSSFSIYNLKHFSINVKRFFSVIAALAITLPTKKLNNYSTPVVECSKARIPTFRH